MCWRQIVPRIQPWIFRRDNSSNTGLLWRFHRSKCLYKHRLLQIPLCGLIYDVLWIDNYDVSLDDPHVCSYDRINLCLHYDDFSHFVLLRQRVSNCVLGICHVRLCGFHTPVRVLARSHYQLHSDLGHDHPVLGLFSEPVWHTLHLHPGVAIALIHL